MVNEACRLPGGHLDDHQHGRHRDHGCVRRWHDYRRPRRRPVRRPTACGAVRDAGRVSAIEPHPIDDELLRMAGNPKAAEAVKESLRRLADGAAGPALAEMSSELLAGRTTLREIGQIQAYATQPGEGIAKFQQWQRDLTPERRSQLEQQARDQFGE
jgi:hypothetical protein